MILDILLKERVKLNLFTKKVVLTIIQIISANLFLPKVIRNETRSSASFRETLVRYSFTALRSSRINLSENEMAFLKIVLREA